MKRTAIAFCSACILFIAAPSAFPQQTQKSFSSDDWILQTAVGFAGNGFEGEMKVPPLDVTLERAIDENLAVGGYLGYASYHDVLGNIGGDYGFDYGYTLIGASLSDHFTPESPDIDLYGRVYVGYAIVGYSTFGLGQFNASSQSSFAVYGGYFGATLYLSPGFGLNGEVGYGNTAVVRAGLAFRF